MPNSFTMNAERAYNLLLSKVAEGLMTKEYTNDDPSQISSGAVKYDGGKPCIYQSFLEYFPRAMEAVSSVSDFGASKYARYGWRSVDNGAKRYSDAMVRHLVKKGKGEVLDTDSGLSHSAHCAWNALAVLELELADMEKDDAVHTT